MTVLAKSLLALAAVGFLGMATSALADGGGLGSSWPNAQDVSSSAQLHAYHWVVPGLQYVQVNDANGAPLIAFATDGLRVLTLPIGRPNLVQVVALGTPMQGAPVYQDATVVVQMTQAGFVVQPQQVRVATICKDPIECSSPVVGPSAASATSTAITSQSTDVLSAQICRDPIECSSPKATANP